MNVEKWFLYFEYLAKDASEEDQTGRKWDCQFSGTRTCWCKIPAPRPLEKCFLPSQMSEKYSTNQVEFQMIFTQWKSVTPQRFLKIYSFFLYMPIYKNALIHHIQCILKQHQLQLNASSHKSILGKFKNWFKKQTSKITKKPKQCDTQQMLKSVLGVFVMSLTNAAMDNNQIYIGKYCIALSHYTI